MAKHGIRANRTPAKPKSEIRAAKSFYEKTHPVGSAERFLDEAAKEALVAAAAGGVVTPRQAAVGAAKAVADEAERYPDPLLAEAAKLPREELMKRAARAAMHQRAMEAQNAAVRVASAVSSPVGNMVANNAALTADEVLGTRQDWGGGRNSVERVAFKRPAASRPGKSPSEDELYASRPRIGTPNPVAVPIESQRASLPELAVSKLPTGASRDMARMALHGLARTGNTILKAIDIPNRVFGNTRSLLQDLYEKSEANLERDAYEDRSGVPQVGETAVHLASAGVLGKALPAVFGANVGADTYETAKYAGASEGEALAKGVGHGAVDTAIWTLGQGLASKYLPKAWQWLGREIVGAGRGAASSVTSDAVLNSLGADISGEEMAKRAVHAAWMVPLLGMLKMGKGSRERALAELKRVRPDLAGERVDKVIETLENEFSDPRSQKVALAWVARKGANLPDDLAQIHQAIEVANKVKGVDFTQKSPFEIISDPRYARYLPKPRPQDVKAFSNMKRYPMGVIGFDVSDDAAGRQATREMINAYMSPSSNPWCLATGKDAGRLGELGPGAEGYWNVHSAVPKQIFFQEVDGKLELTAFRATSPGGEGRQEYWDTSDAGYSGIPLKVKVPGDSLGRYQKMVFRPSKNGEVDIRGRNGDLLGRGTIEDMREFLRDHPESEQMTPEERIQLQALRDTIKQNEASDVRGTFEDIAPGKIFKGDPFRDGRSQTWVRPRSSQIDWVILDELTRHELPHTIEGLRELRRGWTQPGSSADNGMLDVLDDNIARIGQNGEPSWVLTEDKVRTTENGITKFRTTKYMDPTDPDLGLFDGDEELKNGSPVEIEESELVSPEWMRSRGYDPDSEVDVRRMQQDIGIQAWGNGVEAAMAVVPTKRTYMRTKSGTPETVTYGPNGRDIMSVDFTKDKVPYRQEYFASGPADADPGSLYDTIDYDRMPSAGFRPWTNLSSTRLIRNPDSPSPEVLNEIKWDEGLGGFVRTSGNRRWRLEREQRRPININDPDGIERLLARHDEWLESGGDPEPLSKLVIEDRQPDGTWAPAVDRRVNAETGEIVELPPPLPATRTSDTRADRLRGEGDIPPWAQQGLDVEGLRAELDFEEAMERELAEHRAAPDTQTQQGSDIDDDIPFALKAGRTRRNVRAAEGGGDTDSADSLTASSPEGFQSTYPPAEGSPRIVINPTTFKNSKDALCVAFNEGFRVWMEVNDFEPQSEPTDAQRKFFSDTAYADDEVQLRRTILARIATFDTSVKDPTDDQLAETGSFLDAILESDWCKNEWERNAVSRLSQAVKASVGAEPVEPRQEPLEAREAEPLQMRAAMGGGETEDEKEKKPAALLPQGDSGAEGAQAEEPRYFNESGHMWDDESGSPEKGATRFAYQDGGWIKQTYTGEGWNGESLGEDEGEAVRKRVVNAIYFSDPDEKSAPEPKQISAEEPEQAPQQKTGKLFEPQKPENRPAPDMSWDEIADAQEKLGAAREKQRESAEADALKESAEETRRPLNQEGFKKVGESGERLLKAAESTYNTGPTGKSADGGEGYTLASGSGEVVNYNKDGTLQKPEQQGPSGASPQQDASSQSTAQDASAKESAGEKPATDWGQKLQAAGLHSGVFKTMADGSQRELTGTEAAALRRRIDSGASVSGRQLAMFGLSRDEQGRLVSTETAGSADAGRPAGGGTPANPDAGLDREPQKPLPGRRTAARRRI